MKRENPQKPHWIRHTHFFGPDEWECSNCRSRFSKKHPSCPNCGKTMTGEKEKEDWVDELEMLSWLEDDD